MFLCARERLAGGSISVRYCMLMCMFWGGGGTTVTTKNEPHRYTSARQRCSGIFLPPLENKRRAPSRLDKDKTSCQLDHHRRTRPSRPAPLSSPPLPSLLRAKGADAARREVTTTAAVPWAGDSKRQSTRHLSHTHHARQQLQQQWKAGLEKGKPTRTPLSLSLSLSLSLLTTCCGTGSAEGSFAGGFLLRMMCLRCGGSGGGSFVYSSKSGVHWLYWSFASACCARRTTGVETREIKKQQPSESWEMEGQQQRVNENAHVSELSSIQQGARTPRSLLCFASAAGLARSLCGTCACCLRPLTV